MALELLQCLERIRIDGAYGGNEGGGYDQKPQRAFNDTNALKEERQGELGDDDREKKENRCSNEHAAHQCLQLAEFPVHGEAREFIAEGVGERRSGQGEEVCEIGKRHHRAEL